MAISRLMRKGEKRPDLKGLKTTVTPQPSYGFTSAACHKQHPYGDYEPSGDDMMSSWRRAGSKKRDHRDGPMDGGGMEGSFQNF